MTKEIQECGERMIFEEFASVCPLGIDLSSIESQTPPQPDILCRIACGESLAFELTNADDPAATKKWSDGYKLGKAYDDAYRQLVTNGTIDNPCRFADHVIRVHYAEGTSHRAKRSAIPRALKLLNDLGPGCHCVGDKDILSIHCERSPCGSTGVANFHFSTACCVGEYTIDTVRTKLEKKYESDHPIHLLVWTTTPGLTETWEDDLDSLLSEADTNPFSHVWVFTRGEKTIEFSMATTPK